MRWPRQARVSVRPRVHRRRSRGPRARRSFRNGARRDDQTSPAVGEGASLDRHAPPRGRAPRPSGQELSAEPSRARSRRRLDDPFDHLHADPPPDGGDGRSTSVDQSSPCPRPSPPLPKPPPPPPRSSVAHRPSPLVPHAPWIAARRLSILQILSRASQEKSTARSISCWVSARGQDLSIERPCVACSSPLPRGAGRRSDCPASGLAVVAWPSHGEEQSNGDLSPGGRDPLRHWT